MTFIYRKKKCRKIDAKGLFDRKAIRVVKIVAFSKVFGCMSLYCKMNEIGLF